MISEESTEIRREEKKELEEKRHNWEWAKMQKQEMSRHNKKTWQMNKNILKEEKRHVNNKRLTTTI